MAGAKNVNYSYDAENRLVSAVPATPVLNDKKLELTYDYQSRRVRKVVSTWNGSSWSVTADKRYVYDGWNMVEEQTVGQSARYYAWGLDLSGTLQGAGGIGGLLSTNSGVSTEQYAYDGNGNVGQVLNAPGSYLNARYEYDAYGNTIVAEGTSAATNPFRFSTKYLDSESGLYYYGYRYYEPGDGRWVNRDPIEEQGGLSLYAYVNNNSSNRIDSLGLQDYTEGTNDPSVTIDAGAGAWGSKPWTLGMWSIKQLILYGIPKIPNTLLFLFLPDARAHLIHYFDLPPKKWTQRRVGFSIKSGSKSGGVRWE